MKYLTRKEVADFFGVTSKTILNWERNGVLTSRKVGGKFFYLKSEIHSLLPKEREVNND